MFYGIPDRFVAYLFLGSIGTTLNVFFDPDVADRHACGRMCGFTLN